MEQEKSKIPFPQANDFNKIYKLLCIEDACKLKDKTYLMNYLDLGTERQISYYLSACEFLGYITHSKEFTTIGEEFRNVNSDLKVLMICQRIISLPIFGEVFINKYLYGEKFNIDDIAQLIEMIFKIDNYEVCKRRASTVIAWIQWIDTNKI